MLVFQMLEQANENVFMSIGKKVKCFKEVDDLFVGCSTKIFYEDCENNKFHLKKRSVFVSQIKSSRGNRESFQVICNSETPRENCTEIFFTHQEIKACKKPSDEIRNAKGNRDDKMELQSAVKGYASCNSSTTNAYRKCSINAYLTSAQNEKKRFTLQKNEAGKKSSVEIKNAKERKSRCDTVEPPSALNGSTSYNSIIECRKRAIDTYLKSEQNPATILKLENLVERPTYLMLSRRGFAKQQQKPFIQKVFQPIKMDSRLIEEGRRLKPIRRRLLPKRKMKKRLFKSQHFDFQRTSNFVLTLKPIEGNSNAVYQIIEEQEIIPMKSTAVRNSSLGTAVCNEDLDILVRKKHTKPHIPRQSKGNHNSSHCLGIPTKKPRTNTNIPNQGSPETYIPILGGLGTYNPNSSRLRTYNQNPGSLGTYNTNPDRLGTYNQNPGRLGTYNLNQGGLRTYFPNQGGFGAYIPNQSDPGTGIPNQGGVGTYIPNQNRLGTYFPSQGNLGTVIPHQGNLGTVIPHRSNPGTGIPHRGNPGTGIPHQGNLGTVNPHQGNPGTGIPHRGNPGTGIPDRGGIGTGIPHRGSIGTGIPHRGGIGTYIANQGSLRTYIPNQGDPGTGIQHQGGPATYIPSNDGKETGVRHQFPGIYFPGLDKIIHLPFDVGMYPIHSSHREIADPTNSVYPSDEPQNLIVKSNRRSKKGKRKHKDKK